MNKKGFTLIELIVTILLLAIIAGIGTYSVINIINSTKLTNYNLLLKNVKTGAETFYNECMYGNNSVIEGAVSTDPDVVSCNEVTLGALVKYGFVTGNSKKDDAKYKLVNPSNNDDLTVCKIVISTDDNGFNITNNGGGTNCPTTYEEVKTFGEIPGNGSANPGNGGGNTMNANSSANTSKINSATSSGTNAGRSGIVGQTSKDSSKIAGNASTIVGASSEPDVITDPKPSKPSLVTE